jgi:hypothetical protein
VVLKMGKIIKFMDMQVIFDELIWGKGLTEEEEMKIDEILANLEEEPEFNQMFFYSDKENSKYYYLSSDEQKIIDYISKYIDVSSITDNKYCFRELTEEIEENTESNNIEIETHIGKIIIREKAFIAMMIDDILSNEDNIDRLINAKDFYEELSKLKKECLECLFDMQIDIAREKLEKHEFKYVI